MSTPLARKTTTIEAPRTVERRSALITQVHDYLQGEVPRSAIRRTVEALEQLGSGLVDDARPEAALSAVVAALQETKVAIAAPNDPTSQGWVMPGEKFWTDLLRWLEGKGFRVVRCK